MSLLLSGIDPKLITLAQKVFNRQFATDSKLSLEMDERRKQLMFQDILYNFSFLTTAVNLQDENIFSNYAVWLFELLCNLMKD
ncbi:MAG TPA: cobalamin-binding protein, partial [Sphaerochaeta sp.]|nr:cobalamin-binding protein [Sphaerochaeta sp.]